VQASDQGFIEKSRTPLQRFEALGARGAAIGKRAAGHQPIPTEVVASTEDKLAVEGEVPDWGRVRATHPPTWQPKTTKNLAIQFAD
jgi:hypothetical protein